MAYGSHRGTVGPRRADIVIPRHASCAEEAQARVFDKMLRTEIVELLNLPPSGQADVRPRIEELDRLIKALRQRFPAALTPAPPRTSTMPPTADPAPRALLN